jgi:demethylmenaquinone methyltransferase/2-methoxy-6-polyprenyl-1,4-benzoquinol methylase
MVTPYKNSPESKTEQVTLMFNNISASYDFLNHLLSLNIDKSWRRTAIKILKTYNPGTVIDLATGTGDFAIAASRLDNVQITGVDISSGMLSIARQKIAKLHLESIVKLVEADTGHLPFGNNVFDAAISAFGVRNFEDLKIGLAEVFRVLKEGSVFIILEFSKPARFPFRQAYNFYFKYILPGIGRIISGDKSAYKYLPESVNVFPQGREFFNIMKECGYSSCYMKRLTFGIASIYVGEKSGKSE